MTIKDVAKTIEEIAPLNYAEDFDNVGLLVGSYETKVTGVLVTLDTLEETIDEAIANNCNLIVSFHPIVFSGLKKLNGKNYVERTVLKAIKNDIAIYATHTALDNSKVGVSAKMCEVLGLTNTKILIPKRGIVKKLITYVPSSEAKELREKLFEAGAGNIGNYSEASFNFDGLGTYKGNSNSNPSIGEKEKQHQADETCIKVIFETKDEAAVINALIENHSYEEVAYQIISTENVHQDVGMGMIGELAEEMSEDDFLNYTKMIFNTGCIRHSEKLSKPIKKVAVLGGSGSFAISNAIGKKADAYISADFKYHDFFKAEGKILLTDVGHYESEQFTKNLLVEYLTKKFTSFAVILSEKSTNPIYYL
ncbi:Nif3-like dinuclear metal center hexameric protein [Pseudotenacibaculum sp. MALMAid0570]|uniref:Nif3-like dinuclear metal center hexameric protein n=1 Tax=Pseudotenacibaculum sp. MALMAid0570 TaxID=3143938 RepID=UPI0032DF111D